MEKIKTEIKKTIIDYCRLSLPQGMHFIAWAAPRRSASPRIFEYIGPTEAFRHAFAINPTSESFTGICFD
jgi:hypothetical protein